MVRKKICLQVAWHDRKRLAMLALSLALLALNLYVVWLCWRLIYGHAHNSA
jgi:hypothetical protein